MTTLTTPEAQKFLAVSNQRLFQLLKADYDHEWPDEDENTKAHRELMLAAISAASVLSKEDIAEIQLDALTQGRKEGREQGIKESAERVMKTPYTSADNYGGYSLKEPVDILMSAKAICLSLLTHPSPKEQEK